MENDNHRHPGQNGREDHPRDQPLHDHPNFYATYNRRFKSKKIFLSATKNFVGKYLNNRRLLSSCEIYEKLDIIKNCSKLKKNNDAKYIQFLYILYITNTYIFIILFLIYLLYVKVCI